MDLLGGEVKGKQSAFVEYFERNPNLSEIHTLFKGLISQPLSCGFSKADTFPLQEQLKVNSLYSFTGYQYRNFHSGLGRLNGKKDWCVAVWTTLRSQCAALPGKASVCSAFLPRLSLSELRQALTQLETWKKKGKKPWTRTRNMRPLTKVEFHRKINSKLSLDKSSIRGGLSSATYVLCNFLAVFLEWRFRSWRISSRFLRRLRRVRLPLMCSFSFLSVCSSSSSGTREEWMAQSSPGHTAYRRDGRDWLPG